MGLRGEDGSLMGGARGLLRGPSAFELLMMWGLEGNLKEEGEEEEQGHEEDEGSLTEEKEVAIDIFIFFFSVSLSLFHSFLNSFSALHSFLWFLDKRCCGPQKRILEGVETGKPRISFPAWRKEKSNIAK